MNGDSTVLPPVRGLLS